MRPEHTETKFRLPMPKEDTLFRGGEYLFMTVQQSDGKLRRITLKDNNDQTLIRFLSVEFLEEVLKVAKRAAVFPVKVLDDTMAKERNPASRSYDQGCGKCQEPGCYTCHPDPEPDPEYADDEPKCTKMGCPDWLCEGDC